MRAIIYSSGPSMRSWIAAGNYLDHASERLRIGINGGFALLPDKWCHWCASGDALCYRPKYTTNRPTVGFCCLTPEYLPAIAEDGWTGAAMTWQDLPALRRVASPSWSIIAAIALADVLGALDIHIYGCDMAIDKDNATGPTDYSAERYAKEMKELAEISAVISGAITMHNTKQETA
jgi:hypothetical protein